jgi:hypothetical protein
MDYTCLECLELTMRKIQIVFCSSLHIISSTMWLRISMRNIRTKKTIPKIGKLENLHFFSTFNIATYQAIAAGTIYQFGPDGSTICYFPIK